LCAKTGILYNSYAVSKKIVAVDAGSFRIIHAIDCAAVGLSDPRGVAVTRDGRFLVVTDRQRGIYFLDLATHAFTADMTLLCQNARNAHVCLCP
jgi:hypothetical protein